MYQQACRVREWWCGVKMSRNMLSISRVLRRIHFCNRIEMKAKTCLCVWMYEKKFKADTIMDRMMSLRCLTDGLKEGLTSKTRDLSPLRLVVLERKARNWLMKWFLSLFEVRPIVRVLIQTILLSFCLQASLKPFVTIIVLKQANNNETRYICMIAWCSEANKFAYILMKMSE